MTDISTRRGRDRLAIRNAPYWRKVSKGAFVGFRRGPDSWSARFRDKSGQQHYSALDGADDFDAARTAAEAWFAQMGGAARSPRRATVKAALEAYLSDLERLGRKDAARTATSLFRTAIFKSELAEMELEKVAREDVVEWRAKIAKGRKPQSANRYFRQILAAITLAVDELGFVGNKTAWQLRALEESDVEGTAVFLDQDQRNALIKAAPTSHAAAFFKGLECTAARPGELANATVKDYDTREGTLRLASKKGKGSRMRVRHVVLDEDGRRFFVEQIKGKLPGALIFTTDGVTKWRRDQWAESCRDAVARNNEEAKKRKGATLLPVDLGLYSLRHSRISVLLSVHGIDPISVGAQSGTSVVMIEKHYAKFVKTAYVEKLRNLREK
jgi:integrase